MSIALLRHWLGANAPSPHDTDLRRAVRDALIEFDAVAAEVTSLRHECIATGDAAEAAVKVANAIKAQRDAMLERADLSERQANLYRDRAEKYREALRQLEGCVGYSDTSQCWVLLGRDRTMQALRVARELLQQVEEPLQCIECGRSLTPETAEERPYVALPGDVVAYSTHCREHAYQELASALESPPRIAGKTADFDPPGREYTTGDALGLRRDR